MFAIYTLPIRGMALCCLSRNAPRLWHSAAAAARVPRLSREFFQDVELLPMDHGDCSMLFYSIVICNRVFVNVYYKFLVVPYYFIFGILAI